MAIDFTKIFALNADPDQDPNGNESDLDQDQDQDQDPIRLDLDLNGSKSPNKPLTNGSGRSRSDQNGSGSDQNGSGSGGSRSKKGAKHALIGQESQDLDSSGSALSIRGSGSDPNGSKLPNRVLTNSDQDQDPIRLDQDPDQDPNDNGSRSDQKEIQKARIQEKADLARDLRRSNEGKATAEALVADVLRIAQDPDNRYPGTCSRDRYREFGHFSQEEVYDIFGNHQELQRAADLRDARTTTAYRNRRATIKTEEKIKDYFDAEILPYAGKYEKKHRGGAKHLVVGSDFHSQECDPFALEVFLDVIRRTQPEYIALNGDVVDFPAVSKWAKPPNRLLNLQDEIDWTRKNILLPVREAAPDADISFVIGNHEYRLVRFLADAAPGLASLRSLSFGELFGLNDLEISLVHNNALLAPTEADRRRAYKENYRVYEDFYVVTHGTAAGKAAAFRELERWQMPGTSGHVHRPQFVSAPTLQCPNACWMITGMMAKAPDHGRDFIQGFNNWTTGFGFITLDAGVALQQNVLIRGGMCEFGGTIYRSK